MKDYNEMAQSVFERINQYNIQEKRRKKAVKNILISLAVVVAVIGTAAGGARYIHSKNSSNIESAQSGLTDRNHAAGSSYPESKIENEGEEKLSSSDEENISEKSENTVLSTTQASTSKAQDYGGISGEGSGFFIPALPKDRTIKVTGEEITDEEAKEYFAKNKSIENALSASGVKTDNLRISEKGYCHVSFSGKINESFELRQNFRDYLAFSGDKLVAIITLVKENGKIYDTPAFGAPWFESFGKMLSQYKGQELVFVYAGSAYEIVVTPDNRYFNPCGYELGVEFGFEDIYKTFYHKKAIYVP